MYFKIIVKNHHITSVLSKRVFGLIHSFGIFLLLVINSIIRFYFPACTKPQDVILFHKYKSNSNTKIYYILFIFILNNNFKAITLKLIYFFKL